MKKQLFIAVAVFMLLKAQAQTWVTIPDTHFATYLRSIVPAAMHNDSLDISNPLVTTTTHSISVYNKNISDITGVQYFTSLTYLNCSDNPITSLPTLSSTLTHLDCSYTFLTNLPVALPGTLKYLNCQNNSFTSLPALPNSLTLLYCGTNSLTTLPTLPNLMDTLACDGNKLTGLPALPNSIVLLSCFSNSLTTLPALPNSLQYLSCEGNSLTTLPILPTSLTFLNCALNSLAVLPTLPNVINFINCEDNPLKTLPALPASLRQLNCFRDSLTGLPTLPDSLISLDCRYNQIQCFPYIPKTIPPGELFIDFNAFNCLPNYTKAMGSDTITYPLCTAGNTHGCAVAGISQIVNNNYEITVYPNPSTGNFTLTGAINIDEIKISNMLGQIVYQEKKSTPNSTLYLNDAGIYFVTTTISTETITKKITVNK